MEESYFRLNTLCQSVRVEVGKQGTCYLHSLECKLWVRVWFLASLVLV